MKLCPECKVGALSIRLTLQAQEIGGFSLTGATMKVSVRQVTALECSHCDLRLTGYLEDAKYDPATGLFVAGYFVAD